MYLSFVRTTTKFVIKIFEIDFFLLKLNDMLPFDLAPGPQGAGPKKIAVACPIHVSNSHTNFG